jgi:hypothetical protein
MEKPVGDFLYPDTISAHDVTVVSYPLTSPGTPLSIYASHSEPKVDINK